MVVSRWACRKSRRKKLALPIAIKFATYVCVMLLLFITAVGDILACVCLLLQYLLQSCSRGGGGEVEDMCYERLRAEAFVNQSAHFALGPMRNPVL